MTCVALAAAWVCAAKLKPKAAAKVTVSNCAVLLKVRITVPF